MFESTIVRGLIWAAAGCGFTWLMTTAGSAVVLFTGKDPERGKLTHHIFLGFAAGVSNHMDQRKLMRFTQGADLLSCPVCGESLLLGGTALRCAAGHSFDIARQGYVNLLAGAHRSQGYDRASFEKTAPSLLKRHL